MIAGVPADIDRGEKGNAYSDMIQRGVEPVSVTFQC